MKKFLLPILGLVIGLGMATIVWATVIGSPHDLASEPCAMCHTPHSGSGDYPLWNRFQEDQTYELYESISFDMAPAYQPRNPSRLCLVCHNGVFSELVNYPGPCSVTDSQYDLQISGCADLGTNLMDDHPISFDYNHTLDLDGNNFPFASEIRSTPSARYAIEGAVSGTQYMLYGELGNTNWFECATCHSVHDLAEYDGKGDYQVYFLRNDNTGSTMCLDCHTAR
jgi:hypothetical protein